MNRARMVAGVLLSFIAFGIHSTRRGFAGPAADRLEERILATEERVEAARRAAVDAAQAGKWETWAVAHDAYLAALDAALKSLADAATALGIMSDDSDADFRMVTRAANLSAGIAQRRVYATASGARPRAATDPQVRARYMEAMKRGALYMATALSSTNSGPAPTPSKATRFEDLERPQGECPAAGSRADLLLGEWVVAYAEAEGANATVTSWRGVFDREKPNTAGWEIARRNLADAEATLRAAITACEAARDAYHAAGGK